jgi:hypothetical protein
MTSIVTALVWTAGLLGGIGLISFAGLKAWRGWLELRRHELAYRLPPQPEEKEPAARIEMADLKERLRKLEAIARGVDL